MGYMVVESTLKLIAYIQQHQLYQHSMFKSLYVKKQTIIIVKYSVNVMPCLPFIYYYENNNNNNINIHRYAEAFGTFHAYKGWIEAAGNNNLPAIESLIEGALQFIPATFEPNVSLYTSLYLFHFTI